MTLQLLGVGLSGGPMLAWPSGEPRPPKDDRGYRWHWRGGLPQHPVVVSFEHYLFMLVEVRTSARSGNCPPDILLRGRVGNRVVAGGSIGLPGELPADQVLLLWPDDPLPYGGAVRKWTMPIQFDCSVDGGNRWHMLRYAGPTAWYVMPSAWPYDVDPYDLGFEKVAGYASGAQGPSAIADRIKQGISLGICYDPSQGFDDSTEHPLHVYGYIGIQCLEHARLMTYLVGVADGTAPTVFYWCGSSVEEWRGFYYAVSDYEQRCLDANPMGAVTFQLGVSRNDRAPPNPHFTFHAICLAEGTYYDPSYGSLGLPPVIEAPQGGTPQTGSRLPGVAVLECWLCPHPYSPLLECP